jgi:DNA segregation ATPase FtsK/SpoIIIE, S-DNA-T family
MAIHDTLETDENTIPAALRRFLNRRILEAIGMGMIALILCLGLALASWSPSDPSFNHATGGKVHNWMGGWGAILADQLIQFLGLGVLPLLLVPLSWASQFLRHSRPQNVRTMLLGWLGCSVAASFALSQLPVHAGWPLAGGYGGNVGDVISGSLLSVLSVGMKLFLAQGLTAAAAIWAFYWTFPKAMGPAWGDAMSMLSLRKRAAPAPAERKLKGKSKRTATGFNWNNLFSWFKASPSRQTRRTELQARGTDDEFETSDKLRDSISRFAPLSLKASSPLRKEPKFISGAGTARTALPEVGDEADPFDDAAELDQDMADHSAAEDAEDVPGKAPTTRTASKSSARIGRTKTKSQFELPPLELLTEPKRQGRLPEFSPEVLADNASRLEGVLEDFGVRGEIINVRPGPVVTLYELEPAPGIKSSRVISLADDIARSMSAVSARVAVVPGRNAIGIELPNPKRETVYLRELLMHDGFLKNTTNLILALGKNIGGEPVAADLARMPHVLIAGTTGSGKSVGINTMILSLLYRLPPDRCKLIMIDPKMLELSVYEGIPHLLAPVVTDPRKAVVALKWAVREMEERYRKMSKTGVRNIDGYNTKLAQILSKGEKLSRTVQTGFDAETGQPVFEQEDMDLSPMPYIVVIIDEMADLMMVAGKDIEGAVQRLAQMARAAGIHVVMATQRPSVDVITGTIKANFPTRISFQVTSKIDSRTILGEQGAEQLLGQGDMLYMAGGGRISRLHAPFVSDGEVEAIVNHLKAQGAPEYVEAVTEETDEDESGAEAGYPGGEGGGSGDELYDQAVAVVLRDKKVSTSYVQRRLQVGYNKAASLIERMEKEGLISAANATGKREILVPGDSARV